MHPKNQKNNGKQPVFNWHILERCNFGCNYCFAQWLPPDSVARGAEVWEDPQLTDRLLSELARLPDFLDGEWAGAPRLNIAGGEPLLLWKNGALPRILSEAERLGFALSIITNGSLLTDNIARELAPRLQILGISMDSANPETNRKIGRCGKKKAERQVAPGRVADIFRLAREVNPAIECKLNTVVCASNWREDFRPVVAQIAPDRWKVFQMLPIGDTPEIAARQRPFIISDECFEGFKARHAGVEVMRAENNDEMTESYIMTDPFGRFYQNEPDGVKHRHVFSYPIHEVGAEKAWDQVNMDPEKFWNRYPSSPAPACGVATMDPEKYRHRCIPLQIAPVSAL